MRYFTRALFILAFMAVLLPAKLSAQYKVSGADDPEIDGMYVLSGMHKDKPVYSNGSYSLYYKDCTTKWAIGDIGNNCPYYSTFSDSEVPDNLGWHRGGKYSASLVGTIMVAKMNSLAFEKNWFIESVADDGTFNDSLKVLLNSVENPFTGENGEDFIASGKLTVTGVPEGLTVKAIRTDDYILILKINGTAVHHETSQNNGIILAFQNTAFTDRDASEITYATNSRVEVLFMTSYMVTDANMYEYVNDTFYLAGIFNGKPSYTNGDYAFIYKGCKWGTKWALTEANGGGCPEYSTAVDGDDLPASGWYDGGQGDGVDDTLFVAQKNSIVYSDAKVRESDINNGSISEPVVLRFFARTNGNIFTGNNGDNFIADGKATVTNVPEGLTAGIFRVNDTTLVLAFDGNATNHSFTMSVYNITITLLDGAFGLGNAASVNNAVKEGFGVSFNQEVVVTGADINPDVNGVYLNVGLYNGAPIFSNGNYMLGYRNCNASWVIVQGNNLGNCAEYSTSIEDENMPPYEGWSDGGSGGNGNDTIWVLTGNSLAYSSQILHESAANDGSITDSILILRTFSTGMVNFSGENGDDFVAESKVTVTNLPEGLTATVTRMNDSLLVMKLLGNATSHNFGDNVYNLGIEFADAAFTGGKAMEFLNYNKSDISVLFVIKYEVSGAIDNPGINGTYLSEGLHNGRLYLSKDEYRLGYRGCGTKWVIVDGDDERNIGRGYCPESRNENNTEMPPVSGWLDETIQVYPHNSLYYSKTDFLESSENNGTISNKDTLVITYFMPTEGATFSGLNGDNFVTGGKITVTGLPSGLTPSVIRTSDTTLQVVINGNTLKEDFSRIEFAFKDAAFEGETASGIMYSTRSDLAVRFHSEFLVASSGGDFATITEAIQSPLVKEGDILNLAAETFTETDIRINRSLTIRGQGAGKSIVQASENPGVNGQIFYIDIQNENELAVFENMTVRNGGTGSSGGAIYVNNSDILINSCEFTNNTSYWQGGAIYTYYANVIIRNSTFSGNSSTVNSPGSSNGGGALSLWSYNDNYQALIENCTFVNNSTLSRGGALNINMNTGIVNSTFAGNTAYQGGGIGHSGYNVYMVNTLVANNTATNAGQDIYGNFNANYSLIEDPAGASIFGTNNVIGSDPGLGILADNGGSLKTCSIGSLSSAADMGTNNSTPQLDQRGISVYNGIRDIGAFEFNEEPLIHVIDSLFNIQMVQNDSMELKYTVSGMNLTSPLIIQSPDEIEISLASGESFTPEAVIQLDPDVNGLVASTDVFIKIKGTTIGQINAVINNKAADEDSISVIIGGNVLSKPEGANDTVIVPVNQTSAFSAENFSFTDADGDPMLGIMIINKETNGDLEYDEVNVTGGSICLDPSLITFEPFENESGKPYASFDFRLIDIWGLLSDSTYTMTIFVNTTPQLLNQIPDDDAEEGTAYSCVIPEDAFGDADEGDILTLSATLNDNSALPAWLTFDPVTRTFSGTPVTEGTLVIKVTATDDLGAEVSDEFILTISAVSATDDDFAESIDVFPNPASDKVYINLAAGNGNTRMTLLGISGEVFISRVLTDQKNEVDLSGIARGVYLMKLSDGQHNTVKRIVVQ